MSTGETMMAWRVTDPGPLREEPLIAIMFAPVGELVPTALEELDRRRDPLDRRHSSVRRSAGEHRMEVSATRYRLSEADRALVDLAEDRVRGAAVLVPDHRANGASN